MITQFGVSTVLIMVYSTFAVQSGQPIIIKPGASDSGQAPLTVSVRQAEQNGAKEIMTISINGTREPGDRVSVLLNMNTNDGKVLSAPMHVESSAKVGGDGRSAWNTWTTVDSTTAKVCVIDLYLQPADVPHDGGTRYQIHLGDWLPANDQ